MLEPVKHVLSSMRLVLASGSPRRRLILENVGLNMEVIPSTFEENLDKNRFEHPHDYALETAKQKALEVARRLAQDERPPDIVVGADTVVSMDNKIFEKPRDKQHAFQMLSGFSGKCHTVYTGIAIIEQLEHKNEDVPADKRFKVHQFYEATQVWFAAISPETIRAYIETGEPMDKAGGYGIQAAGGTLVERINGDYFNVMGFPLHHFAKTLLQLLEKDS